MALPLVRLRDWRSRLIAYLASIKQQELVYGSHDCGIGLAASAIEAMTGVDVAAQWRGRYDSAASALRMLRDEGFDGLEALGRSMLPAVHPSHGQIGDIAFIPSEDGRGLGALGVVLGDRISVLTGSGIGTVSLLSATVVFRIGAPA